MRNKQQINLEKEKKQQKNRKTEKQKNRRKNKNKYKMGGSDIHRLIKECRKLATQPPEGITVYFNEDNVTDIQADIDGPVNTPYEGGRFRIQLLLGKEKEFVHLCMCVTAYRRCV